MKGKRFLALALAAVLSLALCGCGKTVIEAYDTTPPIDFSETFALYAPDTVVLTVEGEPVTWRELFYEIIYYARFIEGSEGVPLRSWDQICTILTDTEGNALTYGQVALDNALALLTQYHVMHSQLTAAGVTLGPEAQAAVAQVRQKVIDESFGGDEQAFLDYLDSMYCTEELWMWFNEVDALYQYDGFEAFYGAFGSAYPDEGVYEYAAGDPDGNWTEYVQIKQLYLYGGEDSGGDAATQEPDREAETAIEAALGGGSGEASGEASATVEEVFDALYAAYNENADLDAYPGGRAVYEGDTDDAIYRAALALEEYEWTLVPIDGADVYVLRVPLSPDAGVYYDVSADTLYTLRYYAAWQDYSDRINGADGWLATATADWAEGFEDFALTDAAE